MSFPRGASSTAKSSRKHANPAQATDSDVLFGNKKRLNRIEDRTGDKKKAKREAEHTASIAEAMGTGMTKKLTGATKLKVESMVFNKYQSGCQAVGYVLQLMHDRAVISLPGGTVGTVDLREVSDAAHRLMQTYDEEIKQKKNAARQAGRRFNIQSVTSPKPDIATLLVEKQFVRVSVLSQVVTEGSKRKAIDLSMRSSLLNRGLQLQHLQTDFPLTGCIVSKEDHGYIVSAGLAGANLFLPNKMVPAIMGELEVGTFTYTSTYMHTNRRPVMAPSLPSCQYVSIDNNKLLQ